ncbi:hypothetical protein AB6A40_002237 [Gnathostoma spinigerum]|uniref:Solute carrier family 35 member F6 n=1 Tax=Gnathostoma spinigerum TaxID=75299 RepID=A0ABD6E678_9BILA
MSEEKTAEISCLDDGRLDVNSESKSPEESVKAATGIYGANVEKDTSDSESVKEQKKSCFDRYIGLVFAVLLVITGSVNTIAAKWADTIKIDGRKFNHPFFQAIVMFVGEILCLFAYFVVLYIQRRQWKRYQKEQSTSSQGSASDLKEVNAGGEADQIPSIPRFNYFLFAIPAVCDVIATSIQYLGLNLTSASSYQMLRGAVIIFTGLLSKLFLRMTLQLFRWTGMIFVVVGLVIIGVADMIFTNVKVDETLEGILIGDVLIVIAQVVVAFQMVSEQKYLGSYDVPALFAVGLEGIFGFVILTILMVPMYYIHVPSTFSTSPENRLEDALDAFYEMSVSGELVGALCTTTVSIAFFNFAGVSVTKYMSATTRMVLDSVRTIIIWAVSIPLFEQQFIPLQILGFAFLILGMFVYNDLVIMPFFRKQPFYQRWESWWDKKLMKCCPCCYNRVAPVNSDGAQKAETE